jgi:hypothetical protein
VAGAGRGWIGLVDEPAELLLCARKWKGSGRFCSPREEESGELSGEGEATVMKFDDGGGSGDGPADRGSDVVCGRCFGRVCGCVAGAKTRAGARARL